MLQRGPGGTVILSLALVLGLVLAPALSLSGCLPAGPPEAAGSGGTGGEGGAGPAPADPLGRDPSEGQELGPWDDWVVEFQNGQRFRYSVNLMDQGQITRGWYDLAFSDAGGGRIRVDYAGNLGVSVSGSFVSAPSNVDWRSGMRDNPLACAMLLGLVITPTVTLDLVGLSWDVGASRAIGEGQEAMSFTLTGKRAYGGITGAVVEWTTRGATSVFCVNPNVPLALHVKLVTDDRNHVEYILAECGGF